MQPTGEVADTFSVPPAQTNDDRRCQPDRRSQPTSPWAAFLLTGRRLAPRRADERRQPHFVDRFSSVTFILVLTLLIASIIDAILTIELLRAGADELNPLMDHFLDYGIETFLSIKYVLTAGGIPLLLIFQHHQLFGTRIRVWHLLPAAVAMYAVLIAYQLVLLYYYGAP
jgi:hypothetical protein